MLFGTLFWLMRVPRAPDEAWYSTLLGMPAAGAVPLPTAMSTLAVLT